MMPLPISDMQKAANYYVNKLGFGLCAMPQGSKAPTQNGWNSPALIIDSEEKTKNLNNCNIGVVHQASQTCAIDIDNLEYSKIAFAEFGIDIEALLKQGLRITSGRENRAKAIYRIPSSLHGHGRHSINWPDPNTGKQETVFEVRLGGVQDVLPPSIHPDTQKPYEWVDKPEDNGDIVPDLPDVFIQLILAWDKLAPQIKQACPWDKTPIKMPAPKSTSNKPKHEQNIIQEFNDAHDLTSMLEQFGYQKRGNRYLSPHSGSGLAGINIFEDGQHFFCHHASDPLGDEKRHDAFDLFVYYECNGDFNLAVSKAANMLGITSTPSATIEVDISSLLSKNKNKTLSNNAVKKTVPQKLLNPPNMLGKITNEINKTARKVQPVFAVNAAIELMATITARQIQTQTGLRSNLYIVSLGPTGCGKEHARKYIKNMLFSLGLENRLGGEDIASGPGLMTRTAEHPDSIFQIDEFGDFIEAATNKNAAGHKVSILTNFTKLSTSTGSKLTGAEYAGGQAKSIEYPCINLHATGTDTVFYEALKGRHIFDGYLNRMIVTKTDQVRPIKQLVAPINEASDELKAWYQNWCRYISRSGGNMQGIDPASPVTIDCTKEAQALFHKFDEEADDLTEKYREIELDSLFSRAYENAWKVALVCGCAKDEPVITEEDAQWAIDYIKYWTMDLIDEAKHRIANTEFGAQMNQILSGIQKAGEHGITHGRLFNSKKLREIQPMMRQNLITALAENGEIIIEKQQLNGAGRPSTVYKIN